MCPLGLCEFNESRFTHTSTGRLIRCHDFQRTVHFSSVVSKDVLLVIYVFKKLLQIELPKTAHIYHLSFSKSEV